MKRLDSGTAFLLKLLGLSTLAPSIVVAARTGRPSPGRAPQQNGTRKAGTFAGQRAKVTGLYNYWSQTFEIESIEAAPQAGELDARGPEPRDWDRWGGLFDRHCDQPGPTASLNTINAVFVSCQR
jgi:hypothetical protein